MNSSEKIAELLFRYLRDELTPEQELELNEWRKASPENEEMFQLETNLENISTDLKEMYDHKEATWQKILNKAPHLATPPKRIINLRWGWAAAVTAFLFVLGITWLYRPVTNSKKELTVIKTQIQVDVHAGGHHATLTLAGGKILSLDTVQNGMLSIEGLTNVSKQDSTVLNYTGAGFETKSSDENNFNVLSTPRGGEFSVVLPDGTKVWLNAASSLRYPVAFGIHERRVELTGEGYFEVSKSTVPFFVTIVHRFEVQVLGTHFNIMAYTDEPFMATSLLEGKIKLSKGKAMRLLVPGEQAKITEESITVVKNSDIANAIAWRNGKTHFKDADIQTILRVISRWYDVDVEYTRSPERRLITGGISRDAPLSELLKILELHQVHCRIEGKKLFVTA